jgi:hypothetical protein
MADEIDDFLGLLNRAAAIVSAKYPQAQLYEADLDAQLIGSPWRFVFNNPATAPNSTVFIKCFEGNFGDPYQVDEPWLEDLVIELPIALDLQVAWDLCASSGCGGKASAITLRYPLYPGVKEPSYIFTQLTASRRCWVGVRSREVSCTPLHAS